MSNTRKEIDDYYKANPIPPSLIDYRRQQQALKDANKGKLPEWMRRTFYGATSTPSGPSPQPTPPFGKASTDLDLLPPPSSQNKSSCNVDKMCELGIYSRKDGINWLVANREGHPHYDQKLYTMVADCILRDKLWCGKPNPAAPVAPRPPAPLPAPSSATINAADLNAQLANLRNM